MWSSRRRYEARAGGTTSHWTKFYRRVGEKEGVGQEEDGRRARAAALVLQEAVTMGEMDDIRDQLKPEYAELFGRKGE